VSFFGRKTLSVAVREIRNDSDNPLEVYVQAAFGEFFEDITDALREAVRQVGGHKKVGPLLWPELPLEQASNRLRDCLNPERREKLSPEQVVLILRLAREAGFHGVMGFLAFSTGYEPPRPVVPEDQEAALQRTFIEAVERLEGIQKQLQRVQQMRRVA
jgi:hypothetical protein